jgi:hypothetical protein
MNGRALLPAIPLALVAALAPPAAHSQQTGLSGFEGTGAYVLFVNGEEIPGARIYALRQPPAILVVSSRFQAPVLMSPQEGTVSTVQPLKVAQRDNGTVDLLPGYFLSLE